jgi:hypothetical protein
MTESIKRHLEKIEALMAPRKVPKPRFRIRFIDPETREVVHYPKKDGEREGTKR